MEISIKSRIGFYDADEFENLIKIYKKYPIKVLILHLRTREEMYSGEVHPEAYRLACDELKGTDIGLCYNGDITSVSDVKSVSEGFPGTGQVMIGRGFLSRPGFIGNSDLKATYEDRGTVLGFMDELREEYEGILSGETPVLFKLKEIWSYLQASFPDEDKLFKRIKKTKNLSDYDAVLREIRKNS